MTTKQNITASVATRNIKSAAMWCITLVPVDNIRRVKINIDIFVSETASANVHSMVTARSKTPACSSEDIAYS